MESLLCDFIAVKLLPLEAGCLFTNVSLTFFCFIINNFHVYWFLTHSHLINRLLTSWMLNCWFLTNWFHSNFPSTCIFLTYNFFTSQSSFRVSSLAGLIQLAAHFQLYHMSVDCSLFLNYLYSSLAGVGCLDPNELLSITLGSKGCNSTAMFGPNCSILRWFWNAIAGLAHRRLPESIKANLKIVWINRKPPFKYIYFESTNRSVCDNLSLQLSRSRPLIFCGDFFEPTMQIFSALTAGSSSSADYSSPAGLSFESDCAWTLNSLSWRRSKASDWQLIFAAACCRRKQTDLASCCSLDSHAHSVFACISLFWYTIFELGCGHWES